MALGIGFHPVFAADETNQKVSVDTGNTPYVGGEATGTDNAVSNQLTVSGDANLTSAYGGKAASGKATGNELIFNGGTIGNGYGGYSTGSDVTGNSITMTGDATTNAGGFFTGGLYGGYTAKGAAGTEGAGNTVTLENLRDTQSGNIHHLGTEIAGGKSAAGSASYNKVSLTNIFGVGTPGKIMVYGGNAKGGDASHNIVNVDTLSLLNVTILGAKNNSGSGNTDDNSMTVKDSTVMTQTWGQALVVIGAQNEGTGTLNYNIVTIDHSQVQTHQPNNNVEPGTVRGAYRSSSTAGEANDNQVVIKNGSKVGRVDGVSEQNGTADSNTVTITGSTSSGPVAGAFIGGRYTSSAGSVTNNTITIEDSSKVTGDVYGGYISWGPAAGNKVTITGTSNDIRGTVYGGRSDYSDGEQIGAAGNSVTIEDTAEGTETVNNLTVYGGWAGNMKRQGFQLITGQGSSAYGNSVTYTSTVNRTGLKLYGGYTQQGDAGREASGTISGVNYNGGNTVSVSGAGTFDLVAGGYTEMGNAVKNNVTLDGTNGAIFQTAYGGYTKNGTVSKNTMTVKNIDDSTAGLINTGTLAGGYTANGNAENNTVTMTDNANVTFNIYGGESGKGNVTGNVVTMTNTKLDPTGGLANAYGGYTAAGTASVNEVHVNNGSYASSAYGGYTVNGDAINNTATASYTTLPNLIGGYVNGTGNASSNTATLENSTVSGIIGGRTDVGNVTGNKVTTTNSKTTVLYGGSTNTGNADGNIVNMTGGGSTEVLFVAGGVSNKSGNATNNRAIITNLTASTVFASDIPSLAGGVAMGGKATGNTLSITQNNDTAISMAQYSASAYGGYGSAGASDNKLSVSGDDLTTYNLYGGYADTGDAVANRVSVTDSTVAGNVYAGYSNSGTATQNTMTIDSGTLQKNAYGGYSQSGTAAGNTLTLSDGGSVTGNVYGGYTKTGAASGNTTTVAGGKTANAFGGATETGTVTGNTVKLTGGSAVPKLYGGYAPGVEVTGNYAIVSGGEAQGVYGGASDTGKVSENTVTLTGDSGDTVLYGGYSKSGTVTGNTAQLTAGSAAKTYGGASESGNVTGNTANLTGSSIGTVYGGESDTGTVSTNTVTVAGGSAGSAIGGYAKTGTAAENSVNVTGGLVDTAIGGTTDSGTASENTVTLAGGTAGSVYGGTAADGTVSENVVNVNGGSVTTTVAGGASDTGDVTGNVLNINGGTVGTTESAGETSDLIIGGISKSGSVTDNTVNVYGGTLGSMMSLYGGLVTDTGSSGSGNTLNMYNKANTVKNLGRFQTMNFYVPKGTVVNETMVNVTNTADVSNTVIYGAIDDSTKMSKGQQINLIVDNGGITSTNTQYKMIPGKDEVTDPGFVSQKVINKKIDANHIVLLIPDDDVPKIEEDTKAFPENRANATGTLIEASDLAVTDGYASAVAAYRAAWLEDHSIKAKFTPYVVLGGHNLRYTTGSYVDANGFNGELGFVKRNFENGHADTIMPFVEYGNGNFTGHQDSGARSDGDQRYLGAGILLRRDLDNGLHYEGMLRAGRLNGDYAGIIDEHPASYKNSSPYVAAHLGLGKVYKHGTSEFDYYGRFFWTHLGSDYAIVTSDLGKAPYSFDSVNSYRTRLGFRWTKHLDENVSSVYAGLGWDYEFDGEARAMYKTFSTPAPTFQGSSGFLELGWQSAVSKDNPWGADVRVTGWTGRQRGVTYSATISRRI